METIGNCYSRVNSPVIGIVIVNDNFSTQLKTYTDCSYQVRYSKDTLPNQYSNYAQILITIVEHLVEDFICFENAE